MTTDERPARRQRSRRADVEITQWLRDSIIEGDLPPGSRLSESNIGNELGVSRTPVREALHVLASEDLVDWRPNRSAVVKPISNDSVIEALELLGALEELAVRLVCEHADDEQMARLEVAYARFRRRALDPAVPKYFGVNMHLHFALLEAAGNAMLARFHKAVVTHLIRARQTVDITGASLSSSLQDHANLMEAVFSRHAQAAQDAVAVHIETMKQNLVLGVPDTIRPDAGQREQGRIAMSKTLAASAAARVHQPQSILSSGFPLAFRFKQGSARPALVAQENAREVIVTEARQLASFGKEGIVHEGENGSVWRLTTDEGRHFGADDAAPFPLGFFNAGLIGDLANRLLAIARVRAITIDALEIDLDNPYWMQGSFVRGDAHGNADSSVFGLRIRAAAGADDIRRLVAEAIKASPALHGLRSPLDSTFAIYVNGRRRDVLTMNASTAADAADPFHTYGTPPAPLAGSDAFDDIIRKTGATRDGEVMRYPSGSKTRLVRHVYGQGRLIDPAGIVESESALDMPGVSFFRFKSDERPDVEQGPSGIAFAAAAIAFCYMTQIARFIEHQKLNIRGVRLVQYAPYSLTGTIADGSWTGTQEPVDTHLFMSGDESDETHERLMKTGATICFLHASLRAANEPVVSIELNGEKI